MARYLVDTDYNTLIKDAVLLQVVQNNTALLPVAEETAKAEIKSYLAERYDMEDTFSKVGTDRNPLIIMYMVDITLYHLHSRIGKRQVPEDRKDRYEFAKIWMEEAYEGKRTIDLKEIEDEDGEREDNFRIKSGDKFTSDW